MHMYVPHTHIRGNSVSESQLIWAICDAVYWGVKVGEEGLRLNYSALVVVGTRHL